MPTNADRLLELADRIERAEGPDRDLDAEIAIAISWQNCIPCQFNGIKARMGGILNAPAYTASLDAAMTLVPEEWHVSNFRQYWRSLQWACGLAQLPNANQVRAYDNGKTFGVNSCVGADCATPALALAAASLRAIAKENDHG